MRRSIRFAPPRAAACFAVALLALAGCATAPAKVEQTSPAASPDAIRTALQRADDALARGQLDVADRSYRQVLSVEPTNTAARLGIAEIDLATGDANQAMEHFAAVASDPALKPAALQGEGLAMIRLNQIDPAIAVLNEAVSIDPGLWRAWNALGSLYDRRREWPMADNAYAKALAAKPDSAIVLANIGVSHMMRADFAGAEKSFAAALAKDPSLKTAAANLRMAQAWQGRYDEALRGTSDKELPARLNDVGYVAMLRGDLTKAETLFVRAIAVSPTYNEMAQKNLERLQELKAQQTPAQSEPQ